MPKKYTIILKIIDNQRKMKKKTNENVIKDKQYFIQKKEYSDN